MHMRETCNGRSYQEAEDGALDDVVNAGYDDRDLSDLWPLKITWMKAIRIGDGPRDSPYTFLQSLVLASGQPLHLSLFL
jgi:hypothetical protein